MAHVVPVWNKTKEEIEYHVTTSDPYSLTIFSGHNAFLQAWSWAEIKRIKKRMKEIDIKEIESKIERDFDKIQDGFKVAIMPQIDGEFLFYSINYDGSPNGSLFLSIDEACQDWVDRQSCSFTS